MVGELIRPPSANKRYWRHKYQKKMSREMSATRPWMNHSNVQGVQELTGQLSHTSYYSTDVRRLTTRIRSEKCVVRRFRRCANVIQCTYTNPDSKV